MNSTHHAGLLFISVQFDRLKIERINQYKLTLWDRPPYGSMISTHHETTTCVIDRFKKRKHQSIAIVILVGNGNDLLVVY